MAKVGVEFSSRGEFPRRVGKLSLRVFPLWRQDARGNSQICFVVRMEIREFDSFGSSNTSQSLIRLYFFCQFLILCFHVMPSYAIITMRCAPVRR